MTPPWRSLGGLVFFLVAGFYGVALIVYAAIFSSGNLLDLVRLFRNIAPAQLQIVQNFANLGYFGWLWRVLTGNLGPGLFEQQTGPVAAGQAFSTLNLVLPATILGALIGVPIGLISARRHGYFLRLLTMILLAVPPFYSGGLLIYEFSILLHLMPAGGEYSAYPPYFGGSQSLDSLAHLVLPLTATTLFSLGIFSMLTRGETAKLDGLRFPQALAAIAKRMIWAWGFVFAILVTFAMGVEAIFVWPGLGYGTLRALGVLDFISLSDSWAILSFFAFFAFVFGLSAYLVFRKGNPSEPGLVDWRSKLKTSKVKAALILIGVTLFLVAWGAFFAPYPERNFSCLVQGCTNLPPFADARHPFGTEVSGVDVFSESIHGLANDFGTGLEVVVFGVLFGSLLSWLVARLNLMRAGVAGALLVALAIQVPVAIGWFGRISGLLGLPQGAGFVMALGILAGLGIAFVSRPVPLAAGLTDVVKNTIPAGALAFGTVLMLLQYVSFLGFGDPNRSSLGLLMSEGANYLGSSPWVWLFSDLFGVLAIFSFFILYDSLQ